MKERTSEIAHIVSQFGESIVIKTVIGSGDRAKGGEKQCMKRSR